jgi:hypothetical protein
MKKTGDDPVFFVSMGLETNIQSSIEDGHG